MKKMFSDNIALVYKVFHEKIEDHVKNESMKEDLIQVGMLALWRCCEKYDPERGTKFSTYAYESIRKSMTCLLVREVKKTSQTVSFSEPVKSDCTITYEDVVTSNEDIYHRIEVFEIIQGVYSKLPQKEQKIIEMILKEYTQTEIAEKFKMSKSNVGKIVKKFRNKVKNTLFLEDKRI